MPLGGSGLLALTLTRFAESGKIIQATLAHGERPPYSTTNRGLAIQCELEPHLVNTYRVPLSCRRLGSDSEELSTFIGRTYLDSQYRRIPCSFPLSQITKTSHLDYTISRRYEHDRSKIHTTLLYIPNKSRSPLLAHNVVPEIQLPWRALGLLTNGLDIARLIVPNDCSSMQEHVLPLRGTTILLNNLRSGETIVFYGNVSHYLPMRKLRLGFDSEFRPVCWIATIYCDGFDMALWEPQTIWDTGLAVNLQDGLSQRLGPDSLFEEPGDLRPDFYDQDLSVHPKFLILRGYRLHEFRARFYDHHDPQ